MALLTAIKCPRCGGNILIEREDNGEATNYCLLCNRCFDRDLQEIKPTIGLCLGKGLLSGIEASIHITD